MAENDDDLLRPEPSEPDPSPAALEDGDDEDNEPRWSGEESLGLLPPD